MSMKLGQLTSTGSRGVPMSVCLYSGGKLGLCLQLSAPMESGDGYIQLNAADIIALLPIMREEVLLPALRKARKEAEETIKEYKDLENSLISSMRDVATLAISDLSLKIAAPLCLGGESVFVPEDS